MQRKTKNGSKKCAYTFLKNCTKTFDKKLSTILLKKQEKNILEITKKCKMFKRNKNWKILKKTIIKKLGRKRNSKAKMRTKFILKIQGKQLLGTMITNIRTKEFKKENNPNGYIPNYFGGKVEYETFAS